MLPSFDLNRSMVRQYLGIGAKIDLQCIAPTNAHSWPVQHYLSALLSPRKHGEHSGQRSFDYHNPQSNTCPENYQANKPTPDIADPKWKKHASKQFECDSAQAASNASTY
jgi:hypothetical protein